MTPRLDWTTAESIAAIAVRYHCWRFCRCVNGAVDRESALQRRWALTNNVVVVQRDDGAIDLIIGPRGPVGLATLKILPAPTGNVPASGTCGPDGRQFCDQPWPSELLGPVPTAPPAPPAPSPQHHRLAASGIPSPPTCGAQCTQNRDCHREQTAEPCRCVALSEGQARALGSDPVFPGAACLLWGQAMLEYFSTAKARTRLGGRSVEESGDEEPWGCPCNASYVSRSCCERRDGFVWEDVRWKLGRLESG
ncbi:MAG: hypothetical protein M1817_001780 [Caeruleum heppii]|nr:MAG: hypothetical protein M1817_001780 [Caeruleum heppii]